MDKIHRELTALHHEVDKLHQPVLVIPEGFPDAEVIRANVAKFLQKGATRVAHLIMLIHDETAVK